MAENPKPWRWPSNSESTAYSSTNAKARSLKLDVTGVLGILLWANQSGKLASLSDALQQLKSEAGFFIAAPLEEEILRRANR